MLVDDSAGGIDVEAEACRLMGFDSAVYAFVEGMHEMACANQENTDERLSEGPLT